MDRRQMERCLERVAAYPASGLKAKAWAQANGVALGMQLWAPVRTCIKSAGLKMPCAPDLATIPAVGDSG